MKFAEGKSKNEILAFNPKNENVGKGYIYEFFASEIYDKDRVNYFIYVELDETNSENADENKRTIINELVREARLRRLEFPEYDARVYHCCFANDEESIEFYKGIDGFKQDEGMHILTHDLKNSEMHGYRELDYIVKENSLVTESDVEMFINEHSKVFRKSPYDQEKIQELKRNKGFHNVAVYDNELIVGNILLTIESELDCEFGWVEDMFVSKGYRNKGIGAHLVQKGLEYFRNIGLEESRLEVWSSNERAPKLYYKLGYKFMKETEVSIGQMI